jgi:L-ribulose-5-phosphate 3-epimerase
MKFAAFSGIFIEHSIQETMSLVSQLGMDGIEIACREPHLSAATTVQRVKEMKTISDNLGLGVPVLAGYVGNFSTASDRECVDAFEEFRRLLEWASILGAEMVRVMPGGPHAFLAKEYHYVKAADWLQRCALEAQAYDKKVLLEIHNGSLVETVQSGLKLVDMIDCDNVGLIHDAGNMFITDTDYGENSVLQLAKRLFHVHVKDERRVESTGQPGTFTNLTRHGEENFLQCLLGQGEVDHLPVFRALKKVGYDGWVTLECHAPYPPLERLEHDFEQVKVLLGKI